MQLNQDLPQFNNSPTLIIVAGWQTAKFFFAFNGEIKLEEEIKIENPEYSEKDGRFQKGDRSTSGTVRSGAPEEDEKGYVRKEFLKSLNDYLKERIKKDDLSIYLFSPSQGLNELKEKMSNEVKKMVKGFYIGNYTNKKPDEIAKILKEELPKPVEVMTEEAKKILDKTDDI